MPEIEEKKYYVDQLTNKQRNMNTNKYCENEYLWTKLYNVCREAGGGGEGRGALIQFDSFVGQRVTNKSKQNNKNF